MDKALKQRLLGAAVVIALVVIVVPELLRDPARDTQVRSEAAIPPEPEPMDTGDNPDTVVISLPGEEILQSPPQLISQPQGPALPSAQLPNIPQVPGTMVASAEGDSEDSASPIAALAEAIPDNPNDLRAPPTVPPYMTQEEEPAPPRQAPSASVDAPAPAPAPAANDARDLAAQEAAAKLRRHEISRNRAIALERARLAEERRQATAQALAQERARATQRAQSRVSPRANQQQARRQAAQEAGQRVTAEAPTPPKPSTPSLPPVQMIAQPAPQSSGTGSWTVQAGSFSQPQYANQLRDRLRSQQFPATVRQARVDGQTLFRVQIGPQENRATSEQVLRRMRQEVGINGTVMPLDG